MQSEDEIFDAEYVVVYDAAHVSDNGTEVAIMERVTMMAYDDDQKEKRIERKSRECTGSRKAVCHDEEGN